MACKALELSVVLDFTRNRTVMQCIMIIEKDRFLEVISSSRYCGSNEAILKIQNFFVGNVNIFNDFSYPGAEMQLFCSQFFL